MALWADDAIGTFDEFCRGGRQWSVTHDRSQFGKVEPHSITRYAPLNSLPVNRLGFQRCVTDWTVHLMRTSD